MGFGIYTRVYGNSEYSYAYACSCGNKFNNSNENVRKCAKCGNTFFERVYNGRTAKKIESVNFKIIKEDITGFIAERYIDNYIYNSSVDDVDLEYKNTIGKYYMIMDFKNKQFYFKDVKGNVLPFTSGRVQYFLKKIDNYDDFIDSFKTDSIKELLKSVEYLYRQNSGWGLYSFPKGLNRFVQEYETMKVYQILANCGFKERFIKDCIVNSLEINKTATKPNEILGMSKSSFKLLRELKLNFKHIENLSMLESLGGDNVKYIHNKLKDECGQGRINNFLSQAENYMQLIENYNYDNRRLINYLTREVKLQQGIDNPVEALQLLRDTNKMCRDMEVKINEKYPKSLKKDHDIAKLNYKINSDEITEKSFKRVTEECKYKKLEFKDKTFCILSPHKPADLVKEGDSLSHCVSSYIKDVCDERCKIYFIRDVESPDESLLTAEVRNNKIVQVRGKFNRCANDTEKTFISQWAINRNLKIDY